MNMTETTKGVIVVAGALGYFLALALLIWGLNNSKRILMHLRYLRYIMRHKYFVFRAGLVVGGIPLVRLLWHDWSKFTPAEWFPYAEHFYGPDRGKPNRPSNPFFVKAWLHHVHLNPHHWNHWCLVGNSGKMKPLDMPETYIREMVADWMGAGKGIDNTYDPTDWWEENEVMVEMTMNTRRRVLELLAEKPWKRLGE